MEMSEITGRSELPQLKFFQAKVLEAFAAPSRFGHSSMKDKVGWDNLRSIFGHMARNGEVPSKALIHIDKDNTDNCQDRQAHLDESNED